MNEIDDSGFVGAVSDGTVLVDFSAEWCGPCKVMMPVLEKLSKEYDGRMKVFSVDIDRSPSLAARHGVMSVPTFLLFKGGKPVDRLVGAVPERELRKRIDEALGGA